MSTGSGTRVAARLRSTIVVGALAIGGVGLAACGGSSTRTGSAPVGSADFIPSGSVLYMEASTDFDSTQWQSALDLANRFPGFDKLKADALSSMKAEGTDFETDVRPLLGDSAALAVVELDPEMFRDAGASAMNADMSAGDEDIPPIVMVLDLADGKDGDVEALVKKDSKIAGTHEGSTIYQDEEDGTPMFAAVNDGALVVAFTEDLLKRSLTAHVSGQTMADSEKLKSALGALPGQTIAQGYLDLAKLYETIKQAAPAEALRQFESAGVGPESAMAMSVTAEDTGARIKAVTLGVKQTGPDTSFSPTLTANVPASAIAMFSANNLFEMGRVAIEQMSASDEQTKAGLTQVKGALALIGVSTDDLKTLFGGEVAAVVMPGATPKIPAVGAIMGVQDGGAASAILERVVKGVATFSNGEVPTFTPVPLANGVSGWQSKVDPKASIVYGVDGNRVVAGTSVDAVKELQGPKLALGDDPAFQAATSQMPGKVAGVMWVNGNGLWDAMKAGGAFDEAPAEAYPNLRVIRNMAAWSTWEGENGAMEAFITLK